MQFLTSFREQLKRDKNTQTNLPFPWIFRHFSQQTKGGESNDADFN